MAGRDRLRELLDAVLDERHATLEQMAGGAFASPYHFSRQLSAGAGEPPVTMRRRVMLERAAWQLGQGTSVTDTAFAAGYDSVEGFSRAYTRAFGRPPSQAGAQAATQGHWLPAPNGIHFHPPTSLWVHTGERTMSQPLDLMVHHDLDDTRALIDRAKQLPGADYRRELRPGQVVSEWEGPEPSVASVLERTVFTKEVWLAAILGREFPTDRADDPAALLERHDDLAPRWLETVRDIGRRDAWDDLIVDALCEPPESFVIGSILADVLTYAAHHLAATTIRRHRVTTIYYTASSLDGFIADADDSLSWLLSRDIADDGPMSYASFRPRIGAAALGATTYRWVLDNDPDGWDFTMPAWVFTHRDFTPQDDITFTTEDVGDVHAAMTEAADGKDLWLIGGGDLVGQFADAGLLDEVWVQYAPVTLGGGAPLLPRRLELRLEEQDRNREFLCARYAVSPPG